MQVMLLQKFLDFGWPNEVSENPPDSSISHSYDGFARIYRKETIKTSDSHHIQNGGNLNTEIYQPTFDPELVGNENWSGDCVMWAQVSSKIYSLVIVC
jgi:hypothetical protein